MRLNGKDSTMKRILVGILTGLACYAHGGEVTVSLITETGRLLVDEWHSDVTVTVSNGTDTVIRVLDEPMLAKNNQCFLVLLPENLMMHCVGENKLKSPHTNFWEKISTSNQWSETRIRVLAPGQTHEWDCRQEFRQMQYFVEDNKTIDEFQVCMQVLVGSNQWVYSNTNTVRVSKEKKLEEGNVVFSGTFTFNGTRQRAFNVYEHITDGDRFLFCGGSLSRICKVPAGAIPSFEVLAGTDILKVTFSDNSPSVQVNIPWGKAIP